MGGGDGVGRDGGVREPLLAVGLREGDVHRRDQHRDLDQLAVGAERAGVLVGAGGVAGGHHIDHLAGDLVRAFGVGGAVTVGRGVGAGVPDQHVVGVQRGLGEGVVDGRIVAAAAVGHAQHVGVMLAERLDAGARARRVVVDLQGGIDRRARGRREGALALHGRGARVVVAIVLHVRGGAGPAVDLAQQVRGHAVAVLDLAGVRRDQRRTAAVEVTDGRRGFTRTG